MLGYAGAVEQRRIERLGRTVSCVGFGAWQLGADWGDVPESEATEALETALEEGVTFVDTADVYGDGRSERLLARLRKERKEPFYITTKAGRRLPKQTVEGYSKKNIGAFVDRSLKNLGVETIDLLQIHCPPTDAYYHPEVFDLFDDLAKAGKIRFYGVSVERVEEALKAIDYPGVQSVQIVYNIFRQRPRDLFLAEARRRKVGVLARLPLSSGMLAGKMTRASKFAADDHRSYNRDGEQWDKGETFSGVPYEVGLAAVEELRKLVPKETKMATFALRWILMHEAVTCVIPGAKRPAQVDDNCDAGDLPALSDQTMAAVLAVYEKRIKKHVHWYW
jgi:aryl-alcohol dehydrogenase-like predicted oxidoreductase